MAERATARIAAFSPGQSPPAVKTPMRIRASLGSVAVRRLLAILFVPVALGVLLAGCGEEGAAAGAVVRVYVSAPLRGPEAEAGRRLCDEAREQATQRKGDQGHELRVVCLDASAEGAD